MNIYYNCVSKHTYNSQDCYNNGRDSTILANIPSITHTSLYISRDYYTYHLYEGY